VVQSADRDQFLREFAAAVQETLKETAVHTLALALLKNKVPAFNQVAGGFRFIWEPEARPLTAALTIDPVTENTP
jgi:hypothetical protein